MWQVAASVVLSMIGPVRAEDFQVTWDAPAPCPDREVVLGELQTLAGAPPDEPNPSTEGLRVGGVGRRTEEGFEVALTLRDLRTGAEEVRLFRDPSCETATRMAVLLAAVAIRTHREQVQAERETPEAPVPEPSPPIVRRSQKAAAPPRPEPTRPTWRPELDAAAGVVLDPVSTGAVTAGPRVGVRLRWRRAGLRVHGVYLLPRDLFWASGMGAEVSLGVAEVQGCWRSSRRRVGFDACGGAEVGGFRAAGFGVAGARVDHAFWAAATGSAGLSVAVHPLVRLAVEPQLLVPLARSTIRFETPTAPIHRASAVSGRVGVTVLLWLRRIRR